MAKISFLRQQDITRICEKISNVTLRVKKKQGELDVMQARLESVKMSSIGAKKMKDRMGGTAEREECVEGGTDGGCRTAD